MAGNVKKGSITIFLALILSLVLSLVCASIESVRMAAARTQILNSMDIGLYSLFGQYDRTLLEDYELFALYAGGKEELDMASVYDDFQTYMKPVLKQNSQKLELLQGGFNGYQLLSDGKGEIFYQQAVQYMRETLGSQGVQTLLGKLKDQEKKTEDAEKKGEQAENKGTLDSYDSAITDAAQKSEEAKITCILDDNCVRWSLCRKARTIYKQVSRHEFSNDKKELCFKNATRALNRL